MDNTLWEYKTTPGSDHEYCTIYEKGGKAIARHVSPENAKLIVNTHNSHDGLMSTLRKLGSHSDRLFIRVETDDYNDEHFKITDEAKQALAKAEAG